MNEGRVVAAHGRHVTVEDEHGDAHGCTVRGRRLRVVCGDRVAWRAGRGSARGVVEQVRSRTSELTRPGNRGQAEVLAANVDQLLVVCAPRPAPNPSLLDRYVAAAELMGVAAAIVANKCELDTGGVAPLLDEFDRIGYAVVRTSAATGDGLEQLAARAAAHTSILVGQSGVGKSSLLNALAPQVEARVGALSSGKGEGRHTTRAAMLHRLPGGGEIIDSPGVRDYEPHLERGRDPALGYTEIVALSPRCRFADCRHAAEPDCAVKEAVASGALSGRRYASYLDLLVRATGS